MQNLDTKYHSLQLMSIMDVDGSIDIGDRKWDILFDSVLKISSGYYFLGSKPCATAEELAKDVTFVSSCIHKSLQKTGELFFRIQDRSMLLSRKMMAAIWNSFEQPVIFFTSDLSIESRLVELVDQRIQYKDFYSSLSGLYIIYLGIENNVLWLAKSIDLDFPI